MSWAAKRQTGRLEDEAYCLLGLFDVNMPLIYGEGRRAFVRLQEQLLKQSDDASIFAYAVLKPNTNRNSSKSVSITPLGFLQLLRPYSMNRWTMPRVQHVMLMASRQRKSLYACAEAVTSSNLTVCSGEYEAFLASLLSTHQTGSQDRRLAFGSLFQVHANFTSTIPQNLCESTPSRS
jgi:hypothetical protein